MKLSNEVMFNLDDTDSICVTQHKRGMLERKDVVVHIHASSHRDGFCIELSGLNQLKELYRDLGEVLEAIAEED